nr:PREDICTED: prion-like-(Q/N-rich) domain-bearing protein 25 [Linepithema humile]
MSVSVTRKYKGNCELDEQCYIFGPDAICSNKECICDENVSHYVESELFCWISKKAGEDCKKNQDCYVKDFKGELICNGTCDCPNGKHLNENKTACIDNNSTGLGGICEVCSNCATPHSVCKKEVCSCRDFYYPSNDQCLAGINSTCVNNEDCTPENSECKSAICSCQPNYIAVDTDSCVPILSFGESCSLDIQCSVNIGAHRQVQMVEQERRRKDVNGRKRRMVKTVKKNPKDTE